MDLAALKSLVDRMSPQRQDNPYKGIFFKPTVEPTVVRILPNPHAGDGIPFFEVYFHYDIAGEKSIVCPRHTDGSPCPICDLADDFRSQSGKGKDDPNFRIFLDLQAKPRVYAPILVRGEEADGVKLWGFPGSILQYFVEKAGDPDWGDFSNPLTGRDITVQMHKPGSPANNGMFARPAASLKPAQSPIFKDQKKIDELIASIPDFMNLDPPLFRIKTKDELVELVRRIGAEDSDEIVRTAKTESDLPFTNSDSDDSDTALSTKLDTLLKD